MPDALVAEGTDWVSRLGVRTERGVTPEPPSGAWDLSNAAYADTSFDTSDDTAGTRALHFRPGGTRFYIVGRSSQNVVEYHLSSVWDVSTASYERELDTSSQGDVTHGVYLRDDGVLMWVFNRTEVYEFTLSTPWDVTSASQTGYLDMSSTVSRAHDIDFRPDGTMFFVEDREDQNVYAFALSTPWDVETASLDETLDISANHDEVRGIELNHDGDRMFLLDTALGVVQQWLLSTPWDISTATFDRDFDVSDQSSNPRGLAFGNAGAAMYVVDSSSRVVYQYELEES